MQTIWIVVIILVVIALAVGGFFLYKRYQPEQYGHINQQQVVGNLSTKELVLFSRPDCPHCKALAPAWSQVVEALKGKVKTTEILPGDPRMVEHRIQGVPCIRIYPHGLGNGPYTEYKGDRTKDSIVEFAMAH